MMSGVFLSSCSRARVNAFFALTRVLIDSFFVAQRIENAPLSIGLRLVEIVDPIVDCEDLRVLQNGL